MYLNARIEKDTDSNFWIAECPALCVMTQGESLDDAKDMLDDAVRSLIPDFEFSLEWGNREKGELYLKPKDLSKTLALIISRNRNEDEISIRELADLIGSKNSNTVYAYESGTRDASFAMLEKFMSALGKKIIISIEEEVRS